MWKNKKNPTSFCKNQMQMQKWAHSKPKKYCDCSAIISSYHGRQAKKDEIEIRKEEEEEEEKWQLSLK